MASNHLLVLGPAPPPTEKQLKQTLKNTKYLHPSAAAKQILTTLDEFTDFKPSVREFGYGDGRKVDLMQLSGILPVKVVATEKQYKIPVRLWLPRSFPKEGPSVQIHPSPDMMLTAVNYMDAGGMVTIPYLKHWKEGRSDLSILIEMVKFKFCQECPVYLIRSRDTSFSFGVTAPRSNTLSPSEAGMSHSMLDENPRGRDLEVFAYKKTIEALSNEQDELRIRVKELEQAKQESQSILEQARNMNQSMMEQASLGILAAGKKDSLYSSGISNGSVQQQEELLVKELEEERAEREKYQHQEELLLRKLEEERTEREIHQQQEELLLRKLEQEQAEREIHQQQQELFVMEAELERTAKEKLQQQEKLLMEELEAKRKEKAMYQQLLEEEKAQLQKEVTEREKIESRLDSKVSDLTQTRERIAIVEVEKDEYLHKLQRTVKELKHSKMEVREQAGLKRALKARVSLLEDQLRDQRESETPSEQAEVSAEVSELQEKVRSSEKELEELSMSLKDLEVEKQQLMSRLDQSQQANAELIGERDELKRKLTATEDQFSKDGGVTAPGSTFPTDAETQTNRQSTCDSQAQVDITRELADESVQVDTLTDVCSQYRLQLEESRSELARFKEEVIRNNKVFHAKVRDTGAKIHQLLSIKEQLTKKNNDLQRRIEELELEAPEYEVSLSSALHDVQEVQQNLVNGDEATRDQLDNALAEMEEMKRSHLNEKLAMKQRLSDAIVKVKKKETQQLEEIGDLRTKLEKTQKRLQEVSNAAVTNTVGSANIPASLVSFREVEDVALHKLDEGAWGYTVEAVFRGSRVAVRCITKESLARFPIHTIHKQIHGMANTRHHHIALFIAAAMDAPSGMMILMELLTCSLRQGYQSGLIKPDKLPVLLDVALALNFLHLEKRPIVHNNLSSHCVLVEEGAEGQWRAKLSDIGMTTSLMMLSGPEERDPVYIPPELEPDGSAPSSLSLVEANGHSLGSPSLDVYSYGVLMCELASSRLPASTADVARLVGVLKDRQLSQISFLVQSCMADDPSQRLAMANMVKKIRHLMANQIQVL